MNNIKLVEPSLKYAEDIWRFRQEVFESGDKDKFAGCGNLGDCVSVEEWLDIIKIRSSEETCPAGCVPSNVYLAVRENDMKIVGIIDLRHHINHPVLGTWGGHIGYYVRPDERKKGYGKEMLRQNLANCKRLGIEKVLITCDGDNIASEKTILKNGGVFEEEIRVDNEVKKRYWITLKEE